MGDRNVVPSSYHSKIVQPGETVLYCGRLHWIIYVRSFVFLALAAVAFASFYGTANDLLLKFGVVLIICALGIFAAAWIRRRTTEIVVTPRRVIYKRGLIARRTIEMNMSKVETVDVSQSILGRLLNYGSVVIRGSGSTYEPLTNIQEPLELRNYIIAQ